MTMEARCCKVVFPNYSKEKSAEDTLVPPLSYEENGKIRLVFNYYLFALLHAAELVLSL